MRPYTYDGDIDREIYIIKLLNKKYSLILTSEDCQRYNFDTLKLSDKKMDQYIYSTETYRPENLTGKKNRKWRNAAKQLDKNFTYNIFEYDEVKGDS